MNVRIAMRWQRGKDRELRAEYDRRRVLTGRVRTGHDLLKQGRGLPARVGVFVACGKLENLDQPRRPVFEYSQNFENCRHAFGWVFSRANFDANISSTIWWQAVSAG